MRNVTFLVILVCSLNGIFKLKENITFCVVQNDDDYDKQKTRHIHLKSSINISGKTHIQPNSFNGKNNTVY